MGKLLIGKVAFTPKGVYDSSESYAKYDMVFKDLMAYISLHDGNVGNPLTDTTAWRPFIGVMSVDGTMLAAGCVTEGKIDNNAVKQQHIADGAVTTRVLADNAVGQDEIAAGAVTTVKIDDGAVVSGKIGDNQVVESKLANGAVTENKLGNGAVTNTKLSGGTITINGVEQVTPPSVTEGKIAERSVTTDKLSGGMYGSQTTLPCVTSEKIQNGAVTSDKLSGVNDTAGAAVTAGKIGAGQIESRHIADNAVVAGNIADDAVVAGCIADNAVVAGNIADDAVVAGCIADDAVVAGNIADDAVVAGCIADDAVVAGCIADNAVEAGCIADDAVEAGNIAQGAVHREHIADDAITELTGMYDTFESQIAALAAGVKVSLSVSPTVVYKGESQSIALTGTMSNGTPTSMALKDGNTTIESGTSSPITKTVSETISSNSKTYTVEGVTDGLTLKASASVSARYPVYVGFGASASAVAALVGNKQSARTTAAGTYTKSATSNGQYFFILVPTDVTDVNNFTMGGAPFVMESKPDETINGITYKVHQSGNTYNSGTEVKVTAS